MRKRDQYIRSLSFSEIYRFIYFDPNIPYDRFYEYFYLFYELCFPFKCVTIRCNKNINGCLNE